MFYLICLKFVLRLDQKIYKLNPNPEFLASIRSLEALIDRFDINPKPSHELNTGKGLTGNPVIVASDRTGYNAKPNPMEEMIPVWGY